MPRQTIESTVKTLETRVTMFEELPGRMDRLELQIVQLRAENSADHSAIRQEIQALGSELRGGMQALGTELRGEMQALGTGLGGEMKTLGGELSELRNTMEMLHHHQGIDHVELQVQVFGTRLDFVREWVTISGRTAFEHVADIDLLPGQAGRRQQLAEELPGRTDERTALLVLVHSRRFADAHNLSVDRSLTGYGVRACLREHAERATSDDLVQLAGARLSGDHAGAASGFGRFGWTIHAMKMPST